MNKAVRMFSFNDFACTFLVHRVEIGKEETDRDRINAIRLQLARRYTDGILVERNQYLAVGWYQPFGHR